MKQCKACKKEIDAAASKCPHCRTVQQWYRDPQVLVLAFVVVIMGFLVLRLERLKKDFQSRRIYTTYQDNFLIERVNQTSNENKQTAILTYKIKNGTSYTWKDPSYQLIGFDKKGGVVLTCTGKEYGWIVRSKDQSFLTAMCARNAAITNWDLKITDMDASSL